MGEEGGNLVWEGEEGENLAWEGSEDTSVLLACPYEVVRSCGAVVTECKACEMVFFRVLHSHHLLGIKHCQHQ